ncbi:MAG: NAD(P)-binding domain-containing protein [Dehalococcoidia bacterium]
MDTVTMHAPATAATAGYEALSEPLRQLEKRIRAHRAVVGVVGQGYVGFPLAQRVAEVGFPTIGFDISGATVARCEKENRFATYKAVRSAIHLSPCDVIIIAVPTPTKEEGGRREPDLSLVIGAVQTVLLNLLDDGRARLLLLRAPTPRARPAT